MSEPRPEPRPEPQPGTPQPGTPPTTPQRGAPPPQTPPRGGLAGRIGAMSRISKIVYAAAAAVLAAVIIVSLTAGEPARPPRTDPLARNFTVAELGHPGRHISLAAFAGQPVVVNFFASWCPPCKRETPLIARFYEETKGRVLIIGIDANDQTGPAMRFVRAAGVRYLVGSDPGTAPVALSYGVYGLPQTFFLNARHRIVDRVVGPVTMKQLTSGVAAMDAGRPALAAVTGHEQGG